MMFCRKEKWVHERHRSYRRRKVFAWLPKRISSDDWVWFGYVIQHYQVDGWFHHTKTYEPVETS